MRSARLRVALTGVSLLALVHAARPGTAEITVTSGTFIVNNSGDLSGNDVTVDNAADADAILQVNSGAVLDNAITLTNGGTLDNAGVIGRGITSGTGIVRNHDGGAITASDDNGVYFSIGGIVENGPGSTITGTTGIYGEYPSTGTVDVTNSGTITGTSYAGIDLENGGTITNEKGGTISGTVFGALIWGGTVTNSGPGSMISATQTEEYSAGIQMADTGSVFNLDGAVIQGYDGIDLFNGGSITNSGGSQILGTAWGIYAADGAATVLNSGEDSKISAWWGVYLTAGGTITNEDGAEIASTGSAAVYLTDGGTVSNGAGSRITGNANGVYGIYGSGDATNVSNAGTITGDVRLSDYFANEVTLFTGSRIEGDLYVNTDTDSILTLDGAGTQLYSEAVTGLTTFVRGDLIKQGSGTWIIDKSINVFTMAVDPGAIIIKEGTLQVGNGNGGATAGRITANVENDGTLAFNRSDNLTYAGKVSGDGRLVKLGAGTLTLTGNNSYLGGTVIAAGTLQIGGTGGTIVGDVSNDGTLTFNRSSTTAYGFAGEISGSGALIKAGNNKLSLTGASTYTGGTTISAGTLAIGNGGSIIGDVTNDATLAFERATAWSFGGVISGAGKVMQSGAGTITLTGVNSYSGGTFVASGTLVGSAASFGSGAIASDGRLVVDQTGNADFANGLSGSGTFVKDGGGVLTYMGTGTIAKAEVAQGRLAVNGRLDATAVTVSDGATLGGTGTVGSVTAKSGATVAAGNSIGTLTVSSDYTAEAGSIYEVELSGSGDADHLTIEGQALVSEGALLKVVRDSAPFTIGTRYTVLSTADGVDGTYSLIGQTRLSAFVEIVASYDERNVHLDVAQTRSFAAAAQTRNQRAVAEAVDDLPDHHAIADLLAFLPSDDAARAAFDSLSGEIHASLESALIEDSRFPREAALNRLRTDIEGRAEGRKLAFWGHGFGAWRHTQGDGNAAAMTRTTGGFLMGIDGPAGNFPIGILAGFSRADIDVGGRRSSATSENYHLGLYGGLEQGALSLRSGAIHTWHDIATRRDLTIADLTDELAAGYSADTDQIFAEASWRIDAASMRFEPFANVAYVQLGTDGYSEDGGIGRLDGKGDSMETTFTVAGLRAALETELGGFPLALDGSFGWQHAFGDVRPVAAQALSGGTAFTVAGLPVERDMAIIETGLKLDIGPAGKLTLSYGGQFGDRTTDHSVQGGFYFRF